MKTKIGELARVCTVGNIETTAPDNCHMLSIMVNIPSIHTPESVNRRESQSRNSVNSKRIK